MEGQHAAGTRAAAELCGRILVAEDAPESQWLIARILTRAGAEVEVVSDGREAVEAAGVSREQGRAFGLILMDVQMPVVDGLAATVALRALGWKRPIVALTANATDADRDRCIGAGCDDFLTKPYKFEELIRVCGLWLSVARALG